MGEPSRTGPWLQIWWHRVNIDGVRNLTESIKAEQLPGMLPKDLSSNKMCLTLSVSPDEALSVRLVAILTMRSTRRTRRRRRRTTALWLSPKARMSNWSALLRSSHVPLLSTGASITNSTKSLSKWSKSESAACCESSASTRQFSSRGASSCSVWPRSSSCATFSNSTSGHDSSEERIMLSTLASPL
eukprot:Gregarina_sp_Pseudo_9__5288@NODE_60_length_4714_cov_7_156364_g56_i0_p3_GENE_NODE_60_length_4714_cov_7_156364_g56_i0NODE_60_length_4714_cov_7_156364_g56_i0_p3_ORF_typecomplete_len187_score32_43_NODE_60_length_4714_cov_7_156364_g56_i039304490